MANGSIGRTEIFEKRHEILRVDFATFRRFCHQKWCFMLDVRRENDCQSC